MELKVYYGILCCIIPQLDMNFTAVNLNSLRFWTFGSPFQNLFIPLVESLENRRMLSLSSLCQKKKMYTCILLFYLNFKVGTYGFCSEIIFFHNPFAILLSLSRTSRTTETSLGLGSLTLQFGFVRAMDS